MARLTPIVGLVLVVGCSAETALKGENGAAEPTTTTGTDADTDAAPPYDTGDDFADPPVWWSIDGTLAVAGGEIDIAASSLQVKLWSAEVALLCTLDVPLLAAASGPVPKADPPPYAWWSIDYAAGDATPSCGTWDAGTLALGFGAYDPQLDPALQGHPGLDQALPYALYLQASIDDPVYLVGVAGTAAQLDGMAGPQLAPPLPDDLYEFRSLVVLDL